MGSAGNQNPWAPYNNYRDCSQGICSIYCPHFCYFFFPPPPASNDDSTPFSPLIIAMIGVLASAFLLVSYYTIVTRYCKRRSNHDNPSHVGIEENPNHDEIARDQWRAGPNGLDESLIKTIAVCKYKKEDGLIEGSECAVCLGEFQENEPLRLLPKCGHAFHLSCIDTWLKSHSNCPLCRSDVVVLARPVLQESDQASLALDMDSGESQRPVDLIIVVDGESEDAEDLEIRGGNVGRGEDGVVKGFRRSISLGAFQFQRQLLISDVAKIEEVKEDLVRVEKDHYWRDIGSSKGYVRSHVAMKRSISTGGLIFYSS